MAGHSKFKNIMHRKGAQDKKRAKIFTKIIKEITVAVKMGASDVNANPRLRSAILEAKSQNMPKENIERAIKKGESGNEADNYEEIRYEGYAPHGIAIIVEALTDNRNRTASEVRSTFTKHGGSLGENGSVQFLFDKLGFITFAKDSVPFNSLFEVAIELGAIDIIENDDELLVLTAVDELHQIATKLTNSLKVDYVSASLVWQPKVEITITKLEQAQQIIKLINTLEDLDDVQKVFANFDIPEDILEQI